MGIQRLIYPQTFYNFYGLGNIDVLMQERRNSSALAMELHLSCINA